MEALTLGIIVLGAIDTWLTAEIIRVPVWVTFIAWASFFILGAGKGGWVRSVASNITGILIASLTLLVISFSPASIYAAALLVGIGSGLMVQASKIELMSKLPAIVWGFASLVGTTAALDRTITYPEIIGHPTLVAITAMVIGNSFGFIHELMTNALTSKRPKPHSAASS
jgi:NAD/NADP transhydrogenase beta subunit